MSIREAREAARHIIENREAFPDDSNSVLLAEFVRDHFPEDGEERVTEEWLREEWGFDSAGPLLTATTRYNFHSDSDFDYQIESGVKTYCDENRFWLISRTVLPTGIHEIEFQWPISITTRHQARQLFQALGMRQSNDPA